MPGYVLTASTSATCPHGGQVSFVPSQSRVLADGSPVLLAADLATIAGCPFNVSGAPSPCVTIQWLLPSTRVMVQGSPVLLSTSVGLCQAATQAPQGPAQLVAYQQRVQAT
ncbi:conserved hypothetical protein [Nostocoides japonicum T1-X7]|uniref:DUF4280 domain-containing protein n=1 Tax=Nostocoides japonicum T1-X7 TaxID=1194083 RepID=A0A077LSQ2_9MICO|nr:hypothetical protein [Tetrasphaera japonica]CCH76128.1 conserved hypothetical protein [Tetrasphaera japonica T1-X7]